MAISPVGLGINAIGTIGGLVGTIYGYKQAGKEAKKQEELRREREAQGEEYFNRNYYQDYFNTAEAQNAMRRVEESLRKRGQMQRGRQVVTGGTNELLLAQQENDQKALTDTASNLAETSTALERKADQEHNVMQQQMYKDETNASLARENGYLTLAGNSANVMGKGLLGAATSLSDWDGDFGKKKD